MLSCLNHRRSCNYNSSYISRATRSRLHIACCMVIIIFIILRCCTAFTEFRFQLSDVATGRIIGSETASPDQFSYMVGFRIYHKTNAPSDSTVAAFRRLFTQPLFSWIQLGADSQQCCSGAHSVASRPVRLPTVQQKNILPNFKYVISGWE